jgi:hypothetical protein
MKRVQAETGAELDGLLPRAWTHSSPARSAALSPREILFTRSPTHSNRWPTRPPGPLRRTGFSFARTIARGESMSARFPKVLLGKGRG